MLHLFAFIYFSVKRSGTNLKTDWKDDHLQKECLFQWNPVFAWPNALRYFDIEQAHKDKMAFNSKPA